MKKKPIIVSLKPPACFTKPKATEKCWNCIHYFYCKEREVIIYERNSKEKA